MAAIIAAQRGAAHKGNVTPFLQAVEDGVSGNFCDAVVEHLPGQCGGILGVVGPCPHAASRPDRQGSAASGQHSLYRRSERCLLWHAEEYDFASKVWCGSSKPRKMRAPARPFVVGYVDGRPADVRASFYAATYREVVRAWRERIMVCCEGDLVREDGVLTLKNTRYFRLLQEADGN